MMNIILLIVLFLVLAAEFLNGWTDAPNAIAAVVSTKVIPFRYAVAMAVVMNTIGAISGTAVATTIGKGIVDSSFVTLPVITSALVPTILCGMYAARFGLPISKTHALVAGLTGAGIAVGGMNAILLSGWIKIGIGLAASLSVGFILSYIVSKCIYEIGLRSKWSPGKARRNFNRLQILSAGLMAYNHGMNDGQKFIGIFTVTLVIGGILPAFQVPLWVAILCAVTMGLGTSFGGKRIITTLGEKMTSIQSWQGFSAEISSSAVIFASSMMGVPISTTHTVSSSIMGVAAARNVNGVRWFQARKIIVAWFATFLFCGAIGYATAWLITYGLPLVKHIVLLFL
ncbi:MAG: inorganic phosphate transporter [Candidatus Parcubacteria bacterium]|nr:inorganic phosphate transporter [Candidatus Parcubacteria bacterium]